MCPFSFLDPGDGTTELAGDGTTESAGDGTTESGVNDLGKFVHNNVKCTRSNLLRNVDQNECLDIANPIKISNLSMPWLLRYEFQK